MACGFFMAWIYIRFFPLLAALSVLINLFMPSGDFVVDWPLSLVPGFWRPQAMFVSFGSIANDVRKRAPIFPEPVFVVESAEELGTPDLLRLVKFGESHGKKYE